MVKLKKLSQPTLLNLGGRDTQRGKRLLSHTAMLEKPKGKTRLRSGLKQEMLRGKSQDVIDANIRMLKDRGYSHSRAVKTALCCANKGHAAKAKSISTKILKNNKQITLAK